MQFTKEEFLNNDSIDILGWIIISFGQLLCVHWIFSSIPISTCRSLEQLALLVTIRNVIRVSECTGVCVCVCVCVCVWQNCPPLRTTVQKIQNILKLLEYEM